MNDDQRNRAILHGIEGDWREAIRAIKAEQTTEFREVRASHAADQKRLRRIAVWLVCLSAALIAVVVAGLAYQGAKNGDNTAALCALRRDVADRVGQGDEFLRHHPAGAFGIPAATIRVQLDGQRRTVRALSGLDCGGGR